MMKNQSPKLFADFYGFSYRNIVGYGVAGKLNAGK